VLFRSNTDDAATVLDFNIVQGDTIEISKDFLHHLLTKSNNFNGQDHYDSLAVDFHSNPNSTYTIFTLHTTGGSGHDIDLFNLVLPPTQNALNIVNTIHHALEDQVALQTSLDHSVV
jgi:hypothetical protein